jgi:Glycosyl transferase family 8
MTRFQGMRQRYDVNEERPVEIAGDVLCKTVASLIDANPAFRRNGRKEAFVSLVTPDYHWGMLAWLRSLRKVSNRPVVLMTPRAIEVPSDIENVYTVEVPFLHNARYVPGRPEYANVLIKLWVFAFSCLDRIAFVDIDCLFLGNVDALFESEQFLAVANNQHGLTAGRFNSGVMAFSPTENLRRRIFRKIGGLESHLGGDEDALNQILIDDVVFLDEKYNFSRHYHFYSNDRAKADIRILHFTLKKPWDIFPQGSVDTQLVYLDEMWTRFLSDQERSELIAHWRKSIAAASEQQRIQNLGHDQIAPLQQRVEMLEKRLKNSQFITLFVSVFLAAGLVLLLIWLTT